MKVIGLTGGISSGKSTVARFLAELGAVIIDADQVGHAAFRQGSRLWREVVADFGEGILDTEGEIDRKKLGEIVFSNPRKRRRLDEIMHPGMHDIVQAQIKDYRKQHVKVVVLEAPLLIEGVGDWTAMVDEIWVTVATENTVIERLKKRSGLTDTEALARIRSQMPPEEKVRYADVVINTDRPLGEVRATLKELWDGLAIGDCPA